MKSNENANQQMSETDTNTIKDFAFTSQFLATLVDGARHGEKLSEQSRHVLSEMPKLFLEGRSASPVAYESMSKELEWSEVLFRSSENPEQAIWWQASVFVDDEVADAVSVAADELAEIIHGDLLIDALRSLAFLFTENIASKTLTLLYEMPGPMDLCRDFTDVELEGLLPENIRAATTH